MNQLKRWVEQNNGASKGKCQPRQPAPSRPSVIRTNNSYDGNDETFSIVALNLLSRYAYFGLTPEDAICATLVTPRERSSFLEALSVRKMYSNQHRHHLSPSTVSLIQTVDDNFGRDLVRIVELEGGPTEMTFTSFGSGEGGHPTHRRFSEAEERSSGCKGKRPRAFFFPDSKGLFGVSKNKTRNIDWKLAEAIEQVSSLRLDGMELSPTATESTCLSSSTGYEPPNMDMPSVPPLQQTQPPRMSNVSFPPL